MGRSNLARSYPRPAFHYSCRRRKRNVHPLCQSGDKVGLLGLFDTTTSQGRWPLHYWLSIVHRRMVRFGVAVRAAPLHTWPATAWRIVRGLSEELRSYARPLASEGQPVPSFLKSAPRRVLRVGASALLASARYRPGFYPGELTLFTAVEREHGRPRLEAIWSRHAQALRIVETAGSHSTMPPRGERPDCCIIIDAASSSDETCAVAFTHQPGLDVGDTYRARLLPRGRREPVVLEKCVEPKLER